jgi:hypothetical protein
MVKAPPGFFVPMNAPLSVKPVKVYPVLPPEEGSVTVSLCVVLSSLFKTAPASKLVPVPSARVFHPMYI